MRWMRWTSCRSFCYCLVPFVVCYSFDFNNGKKQSKLNKTGNRGKGQEDGLRDKKKRCVLMSCDRYSFADARNRSKV